MTEWRRGEQGCVGSPEVQRGGGPWVRYCRQRGCGSAAVAARLQRLPRVSAAPLPWAAVGTTVEGQGCAGQQPGGEREGESLPLILIRKAGC